MAELPTALQTHLKSSIAQSLEGLGSEEDRMELVARFAHDIVKVCSVLIRRMFCHYSKNMLSLFISWCNLKRIIICTTHTY